MGGHSAQSVLVTVVDPHCDVEELLEFEFGDELSVEVLEVGRIGGRSEADDDVAEEDGRRLLEDS